MPYKYTIYKMLGLICIFVATYLVLNIIHKSSVKNTKSSKIIAKICSNNVNVITPNLYMYSPVYEYETENGKQKYYSKMILFKPLDIGSEIVIYYDNNRHKIVDPLSIAAESTLVILLGVLGMIALKLSTF